MSKRDWGSYAAAGGAVALLLVIIALGNWVHGYDDGSGDRQNHQAAQQQQSPPETPTRKHRVSTVKYQPSCDEPKSREEADVCAQRSMARAAEKTLSLVWVQTGIGAFGLGALLYTLYLTIRALRESKRSADIAERALVLGHRAFVFASGIQAHWEIDPASDQYHWRLRPIWQNSGETPTRGLRLFTDGTVSAVPLYENYELPDREFGFGLLGPKATSLGGPGPSPPREAITPQDIADAMRGEKFIYLWGCVRYYDVFPNTREHITRFRWMIVATGDPFAFDPGLAADDPKRLSFGYINTNRGNCADEECEGH